MPFVLYLLGLAVFAQATSEFMLSGLVPDIAADLSVSIPAAGLLTSAFAVGMILGAPLMAVASLHLSRRGALLSFLAVFLLVHVVGALTTSYGLLLATRVVAALANAGFLAVALATAPGLVGPGAKARATAVLLGGTTLACVVGVPAGAALGQLAGWRSAFWAVAALSAPALVAVARSVPTGSTGARPDARQERRSLRGPRLWLTLLLGALVNGATFCTFTYLAPLVTEVAGLTVGWVPPVLALFGVGAFLGVTVSGRCADTRPTAVLSVGGVALLAGWAGLAVTAGSPAALAVLALTQGVTSFAVGSTLIARVLYAAPGAPTLAGGLATASFNVGAAIGPWWGGAAIGAGFGYRSPVWVSAALVAVALAVGVAARRPLTRTPAPWTAP